MHSFWVVWLLFADIYALEVTSSGFLYGGKAMWWDTDVGLIPRFTDIILVPWNCPQWGSYSNQFHKPGVFFERVLLVVETFTSHHWAAEMLGRTGQLHRWSAKGKAKEWCEGFWSETVAGKFCPWGMWGVERWGGQADQGTAFSRRHVCLRLWEGKRDRSRDGGACGTHRLSLWVLCLVTWCLQP